MLSNHLKSTIETEREQLEATQALTQPIVKALIEEGLFKLFVPQAFDGQEAPLPEALRYFEAVSRLDGSVGWVVNIGAGAGIFSGHLPRATAQQIYQPKDALIAGSGFPSGKAYPAKGGYHVSGRWKYCSGSPHASYFTAMCMVQKADKNSMLAVAMPPSQVHIDPVWNATGLQATASHDVVVEDIFVAEDHTFIIDEQNPVTDTPVMRFPFVQLAEASFASVVLGITSHYLEVVESIIQDKEAHWQENQPNAIPIARKRLDSSKQKLEDVRQAFYEAIELAWDPYKNNKAASMEQLAAIGKTARNIASTSRGIAAQLIPLCGITGIMADQPVNKIWRDLHTAAQHALLSPLRD